MSTQPLVTVITPTYNRARYLAETIDSVLNQGYPNIEYIVLDDGSTDDSEAVLARYTGRLHWEKHANMGEARTVNKGFAMARGELVAVVNSDDPVLPGWLPDMARFMVEHPDVLVAYPDWYKIDQDSQPISEPYQRDYDYVYMLRNCICLIGPGAMIRRSAFTRESGRDPRYRFVGDLDFWLRLGLHGAFARVPQTLATHRVHSESASVSQRGEAMAAEYAEMVESIFRRGDLSAGVAALRRASLGAAYYIAAAQALRSSYSAARQYFRQSFTAAPGAYLAHPSRLVYLLSVFLLPERLHQALFRQWKARTSG